MLILRQNNYSKVVDKIKDKLVLTDKEKKIMKREKPGIKNLVKQAMLKDPGKREPGKFAWGEKYNASRTELAKKKIRQVGLIGGAGILALGTGIAAGVKKASEKKRKIEEAKKRIIGEKVDKDVRRAVKGTEAEEKVNKILDKSGKEMREVNFSKTAREVVPEDIVKKVKDGGGVIQKDHKGKWRIISMKTKTNKSGKPEFWNNAKFKTKTEAQDCLQAYWVNKRK